MSANQQTTDMPVTPLNGLPVVGNYGNLKSLLKEAQQNRDYIYTRTSSLAKEEKAISEASSQAASAQSPAAEQDYSSTNIQVKGVDEADVVKTDGEYIYQVNRNRIIIAKAYPADQMNIVQTLRFADEKFTPRELYFDQKHLVVIGSSYSNIVYKQDKSEAIKDLAPPYMHDIVKAVVYNIVDKANIQPLREAELEGNYVSSRKIGPALYLMANKYIDVDQLMNSKYEIPAPIYRDSINASETKTLEYQRIHYFPDFGTEFSIGCRTRPE